MNQDIFYSELGVSLQREHKQKEPEDGIMGWVYDRLKNELGFQDIEVRDWMSSQGIFFPKSCLGDLHNGRGIAMLSRIPALARYFQEVHGLTHVTCDYLLNGTEVEQNKLKKIKEQLKVVEENRRILLPIEEFLEQEKVG